MRIIEAKYKEPNITANVLSDGSTVHRVSYGENPGRTYTYLTEDDDAAVGDLYLVSPPAGLRAVSVVNVLTPNHLSLYENDTLKWTLMRIARCHGELARLEPRATDDHLSSPQHRYYRVAPGDTLTKIAAATKTTLFDLINANPQVQNNPDLIRVGDRLVLPIATPTAAPNALCNARVMALLAQAMSELAGSQG